MDKLQIKKYIKSFSNGQFTVPKEFRALLGLGDVFWLKLTIDQNKIIGEPILEKEKPSNYSSKLLSIKSDWFSKKEWTQNRNQVASRLNQSG